MKPALRILAACIGLSCAVPVGADAFSATRNVIAILGSDLFVGAAEGHLDGSGTLAIRSQSNPTLTCRGRFTSSSAANGAGQLECSDGAIATFSFARLSVFHGHGRGDYSRGPMSFCYGMSDEEAAPFLILPEGKRLLRSGRELTLVDR